MTRTPYRPVAAVGLAAALLVYVGCTDRATPPPPQAKPVVSTAKPAPEPAADAKPAQASSDPFDGWPAPAAVLLISGEQLGYLEPCGCTQGQLGGMLRRYDLLERLKARKWPTALVDLGSLIKDPNAARGGPEQAKIKFNTALKALSAMKYDGVALSAEDLKLGVDEAVGQFLNINGDSPKIVAANITATGLESRVVPSLKIKAGTTRIGVTAVVDPEKLKALKDPSLDLLVAKPIDDALPAVLADLEKDTDTQVLLVQAAPEMATALAKKYPAFDLVVATSPHPDPAREPESVNGGKTWVVSVGQKGKYAGVVGIYPGATPAYRYKLVTLGSKFDGPAKAMKAIIEDEYRDTLKGRQVVENFPRHAYVNGAPGATFIGAESCQACHANTFAKWASTKHAKAFDSLLHDPKPNTAFDAECVSCHTTGFEYNSGWKSPELTSYLKGNQCENCHGPGSKHAEQPDAKEFRTAMALSAESADKNRLCLRCHDEDNSPHFDFAKYYGQIAHKGLDTYDDPRVHKPSPPKSK